MTRTAPNSAHRPTIELAFVNTDDGVHYHAADCRDLESPKYRMARRSGQWGTHTEDAGTDERDVWLDYNADFLEEAGVDGAWDIRFYPCTHRAGLIPNPDRSWED